MRGFGAKLILDGQTLPNFKAQTMDRLGEKVGGESRVIVVINAK